MSKYKGRYYWMTVISAVLGDPYSIGDRVIARTVLDEQNGESKVSITTRDGTHEHILTGMQAARCMLMGPRLSLSETSDYRRKLRNVK